MPSAHCKTFHHFEDFKKDSKFEVSKAELLLLKLIHLFAREVLFVKKLEIEENKGMIKEIGDEEPYYSTKISIFSFIWAGLAALHKASTI